MHHYIKLTLLIAITLNHSFSIAQTINKKKLKNMKSNCSKEFKALNDSPDSQALANALLEVASSEECGASVSKFKVVQSSLSRGVTPKAPDTQCIIRLKSLTGDIGFSDIGAGEIKIVGTKHELHWDNLHMKPVTKEDHLKSIAKQLKDKGICAIKVNGADKIEGEKLRCKTYQLNVTEIEQKMGGPNVARVGIEYFDEKFGKKCKIQVEDDDGFVALSLLMLQVKDRVRAENSKKVRFTPEEYSMLREALGRQASYIKSSVGKPHYQAFLLEQVKLESEFSQLLDDKNSQRLGSHPRTMDIAKFASALKFVGQRYSEHGYTRYNTCLKSNAHRNLDKILFLSGQKRNHDWDLSIEPPVVGCHLTVNGIESSKDKEKREKISTGTRR